MRVKYLDLTTDQQIAAIDQIFEIETSFGASASFGDVEFQITEGLNPDDHYTFDIEGENVSVTRKHNEKIFE